MKQKQLLNVRFGPRGTGYPDKTRWARLRFRLAFLGSERETKGNRPFSQAAPACHLAALPHAKLLRGPPELVALIGSSQGQEFP